MLCISIVWQQRHRLLRAPLQVCSFAASRVVSCGPVWLLQSTTSFCGRLFCTVFILRTFVVAPAVSSSPQKSSLCGSSIQ